MSGSFEVNARMVGWEKLVHANLVEAMDAHVKRGAEWAVGAHRWHDDTGAATGGLKGDSDAKPTEILACVYGEEETNLYLDQAWFFQGRYKLIERARSNNIAALWARCRAIMKGAGGIRL